jgi:hypothetical protein
MSDPYALCMPAPLISWTGAGLHKMRTCSAGTAPVPPRWPFHKQAQPTSAPHRALFPDSFLASPDAAKKGTAAVQRPHLWQGQPHGAPVRDAARGRDGTQTARLHGDDAACVDHRISWRAEGQAGAAQTGSALRRSNLSTASGVILSAAFCIASHLPGTSAARAPDLQPPKLLVLLLPGALLSHRLPR